MRRAATPASRFTSEHARRLDAQISKMGLDAKKADALREQLEMAERYLFANQGRSDLMRLHRRGVAGGPRDVNRSLARYASAAGHTIARNKFMPQMEAALQEMRKHTDANLHGSGETRRHA